MHDPVEIIYDMISRPYILVELVKLPHRNVRGGEKGNASLLRAAFVIRTPWRHLFVVIFTAELKPLITRTLDNPKEFSFPLRLVSFSKGLLSIARNMSSAVPCLSYIVCCAMEILNS